MSENTVDLSTKFSPEEWTLIKSAPLLAGLSVTLADLRSGIFGAILGYRGYGGYDQEVAKLLDG
jgi:hypothetical protein